MLKWNKMDLTNCIKIKACAEAVKEQGIKKLPCETCKHFIPRPKSKLGLNNKLEKKMSNKLTDLNDHLFEQLDRLSKASTGDDLGNEITRAQAMCGVSMQIINNAALALKAHTTINTGMQKRAPKMLEASDE